MTTKILLVDDHVLFREGLSFLLQAQPDSEFEVVGEAGSVREAVEQAKMLQPDLILMDLALPDGSGADAALQIHAQKPECKIIFLTIHDEDERLFTALRSGAVGFLLKNIPIVKMLRAIRGVLTKEEAAISRNMTLRLIQEFARTSGYSVDKQQNLLSRLSTREVEVLKDLSAGATNREIALRLGISENTAKKHVHSILEKLGCKNRREAAVFGKMWD